MEVVAAIATAMGLAWASGINLYATIAVLGLLGQGGHIELPPEMAIVTNEGVIAVAVVMYFVEFVADKTPGVDTGWDAIHTFIRIPAGAIIAAQAVGPVSEEAQLIAFMLGGAVATSSHTTKAASRLAINTSPEPVSNWTMSLMEDIAAVGALWVSFNYPYAMLAFVVVFFFFAIWIVPKLYAVFKGMLARIVSLFKGKPSSPVVASTPVADGGEVANVPAPHVEEVVEPSPPPAT